DVDRRVALEDVGVVDDDVGRPGVVVGGVALEADAEAGVDEHAAVVAGGAVDLHRAVLRRRADEDVAAAHRLDAVLVDGAALAVAGDVAGDLQVVRALVDLDAVGLGRVDVDDDRAGAAGVQVDRVHRVGQDADVDHGAGLRAGADPALVDVVDD